jgi:hypothetical protein
MFSFAKYTTFFVRFKSIKFDYAILIFFIELIFEFIYLYFWVFFLACICYFSCVLCDFGKSENIVGSVLFNVYAFCIVLSASSTNKK